MLKRRDEGKGAIDFVDIDASTYDPEDNQGIEVSPTRDPRISPAGIHSYLLTPCAASMTLPWAKSTPSCPTARWSRTSRFFAGCMRPWAWVG